MASISQLYRRFRQLIHEGFRFLIIGGIGAVVTFGVANLLHSIGPYKAITVATVLATVITYVGNRYWSFRHREGKGTTRDSITFLLLNGVGLLIYYACIGVIDLAGLHHDVVWYNAALVVGTGLGTLFRFWSYRKWIWTERRPRPAASTAASPAAHPGASTDAHPAGSPAAESIPEPAVDMAAMVGAVPAVHHAEPGPYPAPADPYAAPADGYPDPNGAGLNGPAQASSAWDAGASGGSGGGSNRQPRHARPAGVPATDRETARRAPSAHRRPR